MKSIFFFSIFCFGLGSLKAQSWSLTGNAGTSPGTHFIGTTDTKTLIFKVNKQKSGLLDYNSSSALTSFGYHSLYLNTTGYFNTGFGHSTLAANTIGSNNTAIGVNALRANISGAGNTATGSGSLISNTSGMNNTGHGYAALYRNTTGKSNTAIGNFSSYNNRTGYSNIAIGSYALFNNVNANNTVAIGDSSLFNQIEGYYYINDNRVSIINTAVGSKALYSNLLGTNNTAIGNRSLFSNTRGDNNTSIGSKALSSNTFGHHNTAVGVYSLGENSSSSWNTAVGYHAGSKGWGYYCTYVGYDANQTGAGFTNSMALGNGARVTADNYVAVGNTAIKSIKGQVGFTTFSDGRFKKDIQENVPGLLFINKLKPVTYHLNVTGISKFLKEDDNNNSGDDKDASQHNLIQKARVEKEKISYTGFIAQDVEKAAKELNYDFSGVDKPENETSLYGLRYSEFVVPLVKAVQELSKKNDEKDVIIIDLKQRLGKLEAMMNGTQPVSIANTALEQNVPNPFKNTTTVSYTLPQTCLTAKIIVTDKGGKILKDVIVPRNSKSLQIDASTLASGTYNYSLYVDGKLVTTKQMISTK